MTETSAYNIYYDIDLHAVVMEWEGYATSEQFRQGTELMLNTLIKHDASKVLADIKKMLLIGMEDQRWLVNDFLPRATQFGFRSIAIVKPDAYFNMIAVRDVSEKVTGKLNIHFFNTRKDATDWLCTLDQ